MGRPGCVTGPRTSSPGCFLPRAARGHVHQDTAPASVTYWPQPRQTFCRPAPAPAAQPSSRVPYCRLGSAATDPSPIWPCPWSTRSLPAATPAASSPHLCLLEQLDDESQPVREQLLQLQADDGQRQHGALELQQLVAGHAVQQLLGEHRHVLRGAQLAEDGQKLRPAGHRNRVELRGKTNT